MMGRIEYASNNSGGEWWLSDDQWKALEEGGWVVEWFAHETGEYPRGERWLGALASSAHKENVSSMKEAVEEWERLTGAYSTDAGCACCGPPHNFTFISDSGECEYGPSISYEARW